MGEALLLQHPRDPSPLINVSGTDTGNPPNGGADGRNLQFGGGLKGNLCFKILEEGETGRQQGGEGRKQNC